MYRHSSQPVPQDAAHLVKSNLTAYGWIDATGNMSHYYMVTAVNSNGESAPSITVKTESDCNPIGTNAPDDESDPGRDIKNAKSLSVSLADPPDITSSTQAQTYAIEVTQPLDLAAYSVSAAAARQVDEYEVNLFSQNISKAAATTRHSNSTIRQG